MLLVKEIMTQNPCTVLQETMLVDVITLLKTTNCRQLPVVDHDEHLIGIITDRDVRLALNSPLTLHERQQDIDLLHKVTVEACMTPNPMTVSPGTNAVEAADLLIRYKFGALPVIDEDRLVVGILTTTDFLRQFVSVQAKQD